MKPTMRSKQCCRPPDVLACLLLLVHLALGVDAATQSSLAVTEGGHLVSGVLAWKQGHVGIYPVNPPLIRLLTALPVVAAGPTVPKTNPFDAVVVHWLPLHDEFMHDNGSQYRQLTLRARYVNVLLSIIGGWLVYCWSTSLFGSISGLVALCLWVMCPNVLAWSGICTVDLGAAVFGLAAMYALRGYVDRPGWLVACLAGLLLGLAQLTKFSLLVLYPIWLVAWAIAVYSLQNTRSDTDHHRSPRARFSHVIVMFTISVLVINAGYGFQGTGRPLGAFRFRCDALSCVVGDERVNRFAGSLLAKVPVPLPEAFVVGLDEQKSHSDRGLPAYLRGEWRYDGGWWYYYLYALAIKVPIGTLFIAL